MTTCLSQLAWHTLTKRWKWDDMSLGQSICLLTISLIRVYTLLVRNGGLPSNSSKRMIPNDQRSACKHSSHMSGCQSSSNLQLSRTLAHRVVVGRVLHHLGCHVQGRALGGHEHDGVLGHGAGKAKVAQLHHAASAQQHVLWLQVAVDYAVAAQRRCVSGAAVPGSWAEAAGVHLWR